MKNNDSVTKTDLSIMVTEEYNLTSNKATKIVEDLVSTIVGGIVDNDRVLISGFGKFSKSKKNARPGRDPRTQEPKTISARVVPNFKAGMPLRKAVN